jgi:FtsZ-binding cell division protein ZapB
MAGVPDDVYDAGQLRARLAELEHELQLRMDDVTRLDRELRHAHDDIAVKNEFIQQLSAEADTLDRIRALLGRLPFGLRIRALVEGRLGFGGAKPSQPPAGPRAPTAEATRRARSQAVRAVHRLAPQGTLRERSVTAARSMGHRVPSSTPRSSGS